MSSSWTNRLTIHHQLSMQHHRHVQERGESVCTTGIAKRCTPCYAPSSNCKFYNINQVTSSMAPSNTNTNHDSMQVVYDIINNLLIDKAVQSVGTRAATKRMFTELEWTSACKELLRTYWEEIHISICSVSNNKLQRCWCFMQIISQSQIANFVKLSAEIQLTFKIIAHINSSTGRSPVHRINLSTDYHIIIPFVTQELSSQMKDQYTETSQEMLWQKRSVVYIKERTNLICSEEGEGIYILIEGKNKEQP